MCDYGHGYNPLVGNFQIPQHIWDLENCLDDYNRPRIDNAMNFICYVLFLVIILMWMLNIFGTLTCMSIVCVWLSTAFGVYHLRGVWLSTGIETDWSRLGKWWGWYQFPRVKHVSNVFALNQSIIVDSWERNGMVHWELSVWGYQTSYKHFGQTQKISGRHIIHSLVSTYTRMFVTSKIRNISTAGSGFCMWWALYSRNCCDKI